MLEVAVLNFFFSFSVLINVHVVGTVPCKKMLFFFNSYNKHFDEGAIGVCGPFSYNHTYKVEEPFHTLVWKSEVVYRLNYSSIYSLYL